MDYALLSAGLRFRTSLYRRGIDFADVVHPSPHTPKEAAQSAGELRARALLPAHVGRFHLARHAWDEPFQRSEAASEGKPYRLLSPMIGEPIELENKGQRFARWWETVQ